MSKEQANMAARYEHEIPEGYEARIEGNKVIIELKESEDERIRKFLIGILSQGTWQKEWPFGPNEVVAYLEKQKEQKPAEWSEEDEKKIGGVYNALILLRDLVHTGELKSVDRYKVENDYEELAIWLKSLRLQPSGNFAISFMNYLDEHRPDGKMCLSNGECADIETAFKKENWAKVIRYVNKYQPHWKPSEEQMDHLAYAYTQLKLQKCYAPHVYESLGSLYDDLKKLI